MAKDVNARLAGELHSDYVQDDQLKWVWLRNELSAGAEAAESEFVFLDAEDLIARAKKRKKPVPTKIYPCSSAQGRTN